MKRILGSLLLFSLVILEAGSITATVDSDKVIKGDSVLLTLSVTGRDISPVPDIKEIAGRPVESIQRRHGSDYVSVNGVVSMENTQTMILEFRPDANMTIPSFSAKVDGELKKTEPIKLTVLPSSTGMKRETKNFSLDMRLSKSTFYLGEPIIMTIYFKQRRGINVMQIDYQPPKFKAFFSKQLGEGKTYRKGKFTIQELNYLLIAKKGGKLALEPARAKVAQRSRQRQMGGWYIDVPKWTQISSPSLIVNVVEPKQEHDIVGDYRLIDKVDHLKVKANKPVRLNFELVGKGTLDDYDGINFELPNVTIYANDAEVKSKLLGKELQSHYQKSFVFIADHNFTIPSKEIRVYNYKTAQVKVLKTKEYRIEVEGGKVAPLAVVQSNEPLVSTPLKRDALSWREQLPSAVMLILAFLLGVVSILALKYLPRLTFSGMKFKGKAFKTEEALKTLYPKMGDSQEVEEMVRKLYALKNGDKSVEIDSEKLERLISQYK
jgi:hypothetical protein